MHHAHTNVVGLGDSSVWKIPFLPRVVYLFLAPLAVPIITPLVALGRFLYSKMFQRRMCFSTLIWNLGLFSSLLFSAHLRGQPAACVLRTVLMVSLGLYSQYWLLIHVSGFQTPTTALFCMLVCRAMFSVPYIHVNIFQVRNTIWVDYRHASSSCLKLDANKTPSGVTFDNFSLSNAKCATV